MIRELHSLADLPYITNSQLCLGRSLLNPCNFLEKFRKHAWFPFEDLTFSHEDVGIILNYFPVEVRLYRQELPCANNAPTTYMIERADGMDVATVCNWLSYDEGILWSTSGFLLIN